MLIALRIPPFDEQPLVCTKTVNGTDNKPITREGALYIQCQVVKVLEWRSSIVLGVSLAGVQVRVC